MDISGIRRDEIKQQIAADHLAIREGLLSSVVTAGRADRDRLRWVLKADRAELWRADGHRSCAQLVSAVCHVSNWKARRWIEAAHVLEHLPHTAAALESGALSLDKVVELTRFATPADETKWIRWAQKATTGSVRTRADAEVKASQEKSDEVYKTRSLNFTWWEGQVLIEGQLPAAEGASLIAAVDDLAQRLPAHPEPESIDQRRADALVLLATSASGDRLSTATVVVHAPIEALAHDEGSCTIAGGGVLHPDTARRLACDSRLQVVLEGKDGNALGIGGTAQIAPHRLRRQVFHRDDDTCTFPGCETKSFLHPHHVKHWSNRGPTDLDNLVTVCTNHHTLVHEGKWSVTLDDKQQAVWFRPSGRTYEPGPAPPDIVTSKKEPPRLAEAIGFSRLLGLAAVL
ncbi:MAG: hypothetical protein QOG04_1149 [Actinomycetota bacterium]|nr:hypothetical protein [Actinomycetota bacterium]